MSQSSFALRKVRLLRDSHFSAEHKRANSLWRERKPLRFGQLYKLFSSSRLHFSNSHPHEELCWDTQRQSHVPNDNIGEDEDKLVVKSESFCFCIVHLPKTPKSEFTNDGWRGGEDMNAMRRLFDVEKWKVPENLHHCSARSPLFYLHKISVFCSLLIFLITQYSNLSLPWLFISSSRPRAKLAWNKENNEGYFNSSLKSSKKYDNLRRARKSWQHKDLGQLE